MAHQVTYQNQSGIYATVYHGKKSFKAFVPQSTTRRWKWDEVDGAKEQGHVQAEWEDGQGSNVDQPGWILCHVQSSLIVYEYCNPFEHAS